jgi:hypothetical protein
VPAVVGTTWRRAPRALSRRTPLGILVLLPNDDAPLRLEGAAAHVFDTCGTVATPDEMVAVIAERVERTPDDIRADVVLAINELAQLGVIETRPRA